MNGQDDGAAGHAHRWMERSLSARELAEVDE